MSLLQGFGDGTFAIAQNFSARIAPFSVATGDFDCDGFPDIAAANFGSDNVSLLLNQCGKILLGDVNRDGLVNLLDVAAFVDRVVSGTFQPEADINEDGIVNLLDVAPFVDLLTGG